MDLKGVWKADKQAGRKEFQASYFTHLKKVSQDSCSWCLVATLQKSNPFEAPLSGQAPTFNKRHNKHF